MRLELTRRGDYAVRTMLALASVADADRLSARLVAERMAIPGRFLPHVLRDLTRARLVEAQTGRRGGYRLARPATEITLLEVVEAVEGDSRPTVCVLRGGPCRPDGRCAVHDVFAEARAAVRDRLRATRLADVAAPPPPSADPGE